jgi:hypothetical protein
MFLKGSYLNKKLNFGKIIASQIGYPTFSKVPSLL